MEIQKEALGRIMETLTKKSLEVTSLQLEVSNDLDGVVETSNLCREELNAEFDGLVASIEQKRKLMLKKISEEGEKKELILKEQLKYIDEARDSASELIAIGKRALEISDANLFNQSAQSIKERITMSAIFRISMSPNLPDSGCHLVADFTRYKTMIANLDFLPAPSSPMFCKDTCTITNNTVYCEWNMPLEPGSDNGGGTETFLLQYRQVDEQHGNHDVAWETVENLMKTSHVIEGLLFAHPFLQLRCQAWTKMIRGEFSHVITLPTRAFHFRLDPEASHATLKLTDHRTVEWDPTAVKGVEARSRPASGENTARGSPSKRQATKNKDRFIGESYTILGDGRMDEYDEVYFEVTSHPDSKILGVGVTSYKLSRYEQLGRTPTSWAVFANRWIQNSFVAKHNNKMKTLDPSTSPNTIGVYYNSVEHFLAFYDADSHELLHSFKQVKPTTSHHLVPGLSVWKGSLQVCTGLQVPTWVDVDFTMTKTAHAISPQPSQATSPSQTPSPTPPVGDDALELIETTKLSTI